MNVAEFARGIAFADIHPDTDLATRPDWAALTDLGRLNREIDNTLLPDSGDELRQRLAPVMRMARMSTFAVAALMLDRSTAHNKHPTFWNGLMLLRSSARE